MPAAPWSPPSANPGARAPGGPARTTRGQGHRRHRPSVPQGMTAVSNGNLPRSDRPDLLLGGAACPSRPTWSAWPSPNTPSIAAQYQGSARARSTSNHFVFPELADEAAADFAILPDMLDFCGDLFGPYPFPGQNYGMAHVPVGPGHGAPHGRHLGRCAGHRRRPVRDHPHARTGPHVVRQPDHARGLDPHLAERGLRHLRRSPVGRAPDGAAPACAAS